MLKIKYKTLLDPDFIAGMNALGAITDIKSSLVLLQVGKMVKRLRECSQEFQEAREKILTDVGHAPGVVLPTEKQEELATRMKELLELEFEVDQKKISLKDLPHKTLSGSHVASLDQVLVIPD